MRSLTTSRAADLLGVSADTVRRLADTGQLPSYRLHLPAGWRRFDAVAVLDFKDHLRQSPRDKDGGA